MGVADGVTFTARLAATLLAILLLAMLGRAAARLLRQPEVVGEIMAGLFAGPLVVGLFGGDALHSLLPANMLDTLKLVSEGGLALFLVGTTHKLRLGVQRTVRQAAGPVALGAFALPLATGALLAGWLAWKGDQAVRGHAPTSAFVLMVAVSMSITAVPVLARILEERGMLGSVTGRVAMFAAILIDIAGWILLSVAVGLASGSPAGFLRSMEIFAAGALLALGARRALGSRLGTVMVTRARRRTALAIGALAIASALASERLGLTAVFGAVLLGLAVPATDSAPWESAVASVTRVGRGLVPVFFVVTGVTVLTAGFGDTPWGLVAVIVVLGAVSKIGGTYLGARLGRQERRESLTAGVLMNTRGLTELVVLKVGYSAGILSPPLFLAMVLMALVTTAMTGPCLLLLRGRDAQAERVPVGAAT
ncbi:cation:proton antiporter [Streptomyces sp. TLI_105]|uniref:cation:proton antiporter n=1 Tax=Streptomyces sp. TLI_105 TaxID=1881019 RepID=UPI00089B30A8|nr:cation:proton antiporter [Streptomyces sp. TLI_105]SEC31589.1 transporter, CPA2 family [Streptomyces sp. TLI_105]